MQAITFQIQIEPDKFLDEQSLAILHKRMIDFVLSVEAYGFTRYQMFIDNITYEHTR